VFIRVIGGERESNTYQYKRNSAHLVRIFFRAFLSFIMFVTTSKPSAVTKACIFAFQHKDPQQEQRTEKHEEGSVRAESNTVRADVCISSVSAVRNCMHTW
jgi:hypothetical protein